mmetsp:Transcript_89728/g.253008  ORF Transcript_89728/g.253008 Transcript_89728/m.253008 type:complete len:127 (+) Transcript_89728:103-483(+)
MALLAADASIVRHVFLSLTGLDIAYKQDVDSDQWPSSLPQLALCHTLLFLGDGAGWAIRVPSHVLHRLSGDAVHQCWKSFQTCSQVFGNHLMGLSSWHPRGLARPPLCRLLLLMLVRMRFQTASSL